jgi:hypothetical protein
VRNARPATASTTLYILCLTGRTANAKADSFLYAYLESDPLRHGWKLIESCGRLRGPDTRRILRLLIAQLKQQPVMLQHAADALALHGSQALNELKEAMRSASGDMRDTYEYALTRFP